MRASPSGVALALLLGACVAPTAAPPSASPAPPPTATSVATDSSLVWAADVNGDGRADEVSVDARATVRAALGGGTVLELVLADAPEPRLEAIGDLDADGRDELLIRVSRGAATEFYAIVALDGGALVRVRESGSEQPLDIGVGGSVTHGDGVDCRFPAGGPAELVLWSFRSLESPGLKESVYVWRGKALVLRDVRARAFSEEMRAEPDFARYYTISCEARSALR